MRMVVVSLFALFLACGPAVSEVRMIPSPPREAGCALEFVKLDMMDLSSETGTWQVIGYVALADNGAQDPFSEKNRAIVRPRACQMGGEGVTLMASATNETIVSTGSRITYGVLRHRSSVAEAPKSF